MLLVNTSSTIKVFIIHICYIGLKGIHYGTRNPSIIPTLLPTKLLTRQELAKIQKEEKKLQEEKKKKDKLINEQRQEKIKQLNDNSLKNPIKLNQELLKHSQESSELSIKTSHTTSSSKSNIIEYILSRIRNKESSNNNFQYPRNIHELTPHFLMMIIYMIILFFVSILLLYYM